MECDFYVFGDAYICLTFDLQASRTNWETCPLIAIRSGRTNELQALYSNAGK